MTGTERPGAFAGMRIAVVAGTYDPEKDGVSHYTARLREELAERGVGSVVITTHEAARRAGDPSVVGAAEGWRPRDLPALARAVPRIARMEGAELVHVQHAAGTYGFSRAVFFLPPLVRAAGFGGPVVSTLHEYGWWEWEPRGVPRRPLERLKGWGQRRGLWDREDGFLITSSDAVITTNADDEGVLLGRLPHLKDRVRRIPMAANVEVAPVDRVEARRALRRELGWPEESEVVVFFGFLHPVKGLEALLPAFERVLASRPRARLLLVGGVESLALRGEEAERYEKGLRALVGRLGLGDRVGMTGYLPDGEASRRLCGADVGALPFNYGITLKSGALLTMLAHGLPVVATRHDPPDRDLAGPVRERAVHLVEPRDPGGLARALAGLLVDPDRARLGERGRAFASSFSWPAIADRHLEVYGSVLERRPVPPGRLRP